MLMHLLFHYFRTETSVIDRFPILSIAIKDIDDYAEMWGKVYWRYALY